MYKISVIIPVYNVEKYLAKCLESLVEQTIFHDMEFIVIEDGSTDASGKICDAYAEKYKNFTVIHQENGGVSTARNKGISLATGDYIAFVDADDYVEEWYFEEIYKDAEKFGADLVVYDYFLEFENGQRKAYRKKGKNFKYSRKEALKKYLSGEDIGVNLFDKIFKRDSINELMFRNNIRIGEDLDYIFRFLKKCRFVYGKAKPGYHYVQRVGSAMNSKFDEKNFDVIWLSKKIVEEIKEYDIELLPYAEALYIHSAYKTLERAYKSKETEEYREYLERLLEDVRGYSCLKAKKYLSRRQCIGFFLMKFSPRMYMTVCKIKKI